MGTLTYSDYYESRQKKSTATTKDFKVGYFNSLKDDGDEAIVRFAYNTVQEFDIQTVHVVKVGDKYKRISCLRNSASEPETNCPLCVKGDSYKTKFYVKVIEYTTDENGKIVASAKVWERPAKFTKKIMNAVNSAVEMGIYSSLSTIGDIVFKVKRVGAKKCKDTDYEVIPANPNIFKSDLYVKDFSDFDGLDLAHHSYKVKTKEEIEEFLKTGEFPTTNSSTTYSSVEEKTTSVSTGYSSQDVTKQEPVFNSPRRYTF